MSDPVEQARQLLVGEAQRLGRFLGETQTRARAPAVRKLHEIRRMLDSNYHYTSQAGQDNVVDRLSKAARDGTFVDVGGYDGVTGSNTLFLEAFRGWNGILVEPVPTQLQKASNARTCECLGLAIAAQEGEADFIEVSEGFTQMSGLRATYDDTLLKTVRAGKRHKEKVRKVQTRTLSNLLNEFDIPHPDFISLDIEGGELECLRQFPFADHDVRFWSIENNSGGSEIKQIMNNAGYQLMEFCGPDEIYEKREKRLEL